MINLLPDEMKYQLRAARVNVLLTRYLVVIFLAAAFLGFILVGSFYLLDQTRLSAQKLIEANDTKADVYSETRTQVETLSASLSGARAILDQEVLYSKVLMNFGQQMTPGTVLEKLTLDSNSFNGTPLNLTIYAKSTDAAVALQEKFQNSPHFTNVSFQSISDTSGGIAGYPVTVSLTLTLNRSIAQ